MTLLGMGAGGLNVKFLSRCPCRVLAATAFVGEVNTENVMELHGRPADPEDVVRSRGKDPQPLMEDGALSDTTGAVGLAAVLTCTVCKGMAAQVPHHVAFLLLHRARIFHGANVISLLTETMPSTGSPEYRG
jgi:hypothetical protein